MKNETYFYATLVFLSVIFVLCYQNKLQADSPELYFDNQTTYLRDITFKVFPISCVFNATGRYSLEAIFDENTYHYINGRNSSSNEFTLHPADNAGFSHEAHPPSDGNLGTLGYGKYKIIVTWNSGSDTCTIEYDLGYGINIPNSNFSADCRIIFRDDNNDPRIVFKWSVNGTERNCRDYNKKIEAWNQYENGTRTKNPGNFIYNSTQNSYVVFPQDSRRDCAPTENQSFTDSRSGYLTLNLSIDKNVNSPSLVDMPEIPTIFNITSSGLLDLDTNRVIDLVEPTVPSDPIIFIMNVETLGSLLLRYNSKLYVRNKNQLTFQKNSKIYLGNNSEIYIFQGGSFCNYGALIRGNGKIIYRGGSTTFNQCNTPNGDLAFRDSAKVILDTNAILEVPDSTIFHFTGTQTSLVLNPGSNIKFGKGSKIIIDSGATLIANNSSFISSDTSETWEGIVLNNSGVDSIIDCTFSNAKTSLSIINDANHSNTNRIVKRNTFNVPSGELGRGIYGENNYRLLVQNNIFNMPLTSTLTPDLTFVGLYLKNSNTGGAAGEPEESAENPYSLNVVGNTFNNGCASVILANYLSNLLPYNVKHNTFNDASSVNLIGIQIEGRIKNNSFTSDEVPIGIHLISSNPDLYNNLIEAKEIGIHMTGNCYPRMAPYVSGSDQVWVGGTNAITTSESDNIQLESAGNIFTDWGNNSFNLLEDSTYHIYGFVDSTMHAYYTRDNCWNSSGTPTLSLTKNNSQWIVPSVYYNAWLDCIYSTSATGYNVVNLGNGVVDSVRLTSDFTSYEPSEEEILLYTAYNYSLNYDYPNAIATYKALIDSDTTFIYIASAVDYLYENYLALDTNDQNHRNDLFYDLINYLEPKVLSEEYPTEFNEAAYDVLLMSYAKLGEYSYTMDGYGMLAIYHPDPNIRLSASWNYTEIEDLIELGEGGGFKGDMNNSEELEEYETDMIFKLKKKINDNPISKVIKRNFDKQNKEKKTKEENELKSAQTKNEKSLIIRNKELDKQKEDRAKSNMLFGKNMTKLESEKRRMEDLSVTIMNTRKLSSGNRLGSIVPLEYKLSQNYPNPFNPLTRIDFQLPKNVNVKIKIYDVSGREIKTLINEFKQAGSYNVSFDGSNLSSGAYFYRIEAGDFIQTKRMVLIK